MKVKLIYHLSTEKPPNSTMILGPSLDVLGVRPHQVTKRTLCGDLLQTVYLSDLVDCMNVGRKPSVNT